MKALLPLLCLLLTVGCGSGQNADTSDTYLSEIHAVRWPTRAVTYYIAPQSSSIPGLDIPRTVERGLREWQEPLTGRITLIKTTDQATAHISIRFGTRDEVGTRQGYTNLFYVDAEQTTLRRAEIVIYRGLTPQNLHATSRHEMGHGLGIRQHVADKSSVMFHYPRWWASLSGRDERTIQAMYP